MQYICFQFKTPFPVSHVVQRVTLPMDSSPPMINNLSGQAHL